jgi:alginate O-acetyltransferase complex protein AlgI
MNFYSVAFLLFFLLFFVCYWFLFHKKTKVQNVLILVASYVFYSWTDWRFAFYLAGASILNYYLGLRIANSKAQTQKRLFALIGLVQGIGGLAFFKYYNFFISSFNDVFETLNLNINLQTLNILVPLGISYFTFKTISYILDVKNEKVHATTDWVVFFNYVAFFPTILSGPIDKSKSFIPQLEKRRIFNPGQASDGLRQILWGLFKKVVIADNIAPITSSIFENYDSLPGSSLLLGAFLYTIQLYADFSGYSDMAIGFSRLLGFNVTMNFNFPFFAQNIADFWRKWHISLTTWLTEYVFTPLSIQFRDYRNWGIVLAILINFTVIGIWHGANWTYVFFGFLHGCYFIPLILRGKFNKKKKIPKERVVPTPKEFMNIVITFSLVMFSFIIFRSESISQAFDFISKIVSPTTLSMPYIVEDGTGAHILPKQIFVLIVLCFSIEWFGRNGSYAIEKVGLTWNRYLRFAFYYALIILTVWFSTQEQQFIYFQF